MTAEPLLSREEIEAIVELRAPTTPGQIPVRPVDLLAADRFLHDVLPLLEVGFSRAATAATSVLTSLLGVAAEVTSEPTEILTGRGLFEVLAPAQALVGLRTRGGHADGHALIAVDAHLTYRLLERLFGSSGSADAPTVLERPPTRLERQMLLQNLTPLIDAFQAALEPRGYFSFAPSSVESDLAMLPGFSADVTVMHVPFSVALGGGYASFSLALTAPLLEPMRDRTAAPPAGVQGETLAEVLPAVPCTLVAELGATELSLADLAELSPGQILHLDRGPGDEIAVYVEGRTKFFGIAVADGGALAVELTRSNQP